MAISDHISPREALRADMKDHFRVLAEAAMERVDCADMITSEVDPEGQAIAAWQNVPVLTARALQTIVHEVFEGPLAPPSERTAEVAVTSKAAALVVVSAECPRCHISQRMPMTVDVQMIQDRDGESLKLKPASKEAAHNCGQLPLPEAEDGQEKLPFEEEEDAEGDAGPEYSGPRLLNAGEAVEGEYSEVPTSAVLLDLIRLVIDEIPLDHQPNFAAIEAWDDATKREVSDWAARVHLSASDEPDVKVPPLPLVLGGSMDYIEDAADVEEESESDLLPGGPEPTNIRCPRCGRPLPFNVVHERPEDCLQA